ncbi:MAG: hypothetical protein J0L75_03955 [Spirochaetes bacterium]|nr:hypothetical protein [Spirochaetota bacterium]
MKSLALALALSLALLPLCGAEKDLLLHWNFEEGKGSATKDLSGNGLTGTVVGKFVRVGKGFALSLSGEDKNGVAVVPPPEKQIGKGDFTLLFWVKASSFGKQRRLFGMDKCFPAFYISMDVREDGNFSFGAAGKNSQGKSVSGGSGGGAQLALGAWTHVAATFDRGAKKARLYVDGKQKAEGGIPADFDVDLSCDKGFGIGNWQALDALLDEVRIYRRALSADEIAGQHRELRPVFDAAQTVVKLALKAAPVYFVATNGRDEWSGTLAEPSPDGKDGPLPTLEAARDTIRALKAKGLMPSGGVAVEVRGGSYEMSAPFTLEAVDSGTAASPIVYRARSGEEVRLVGGVSLPAKAFSLPRSERVLARLAPEGRGKILAASLPTLGVSETGKIPPQFIGFPAVPELFFNDRRMTLARWPNTHWTTVKTILDSGSSRSVPPAERRGGIIEYADERHGNWDVEKGVWLHGYWCFDWYDETILVKSIDKDRKEIALSEAAVYTIKQGNPSPRRYYAVNILEELDSPGEYFIDRGDGMLYFWPPAPIDGARVVLSTLGEPIVSLKGAEQVTLRGFIVEAGIAHGVLVKGGRHVRLEGLTTRNLRQLGIQILDGSAHVVSGCEVYETGEGGINAEAGDRKTLAPAGLIVSNNHVHHFAIHKLCYANGIRLAGVGNLATHNLLHDAPHQAVSVSGNDHVFEYNELHDVCMASDDAGAYYKGRNPSMRGNIVRYNFWHHIGSPMGHGNAAIYFDDGDGGESVIGNVFFKCGEPGKGSFGTIFSHGGHDNLAEGNLFIALKRALGSAPWNDKRWADYLKTELLARMTKEVDVTQPPYTTRYPGLVGIMEPNPDQIRSNYASNNVLVGCGEATSGRWDFVEDGNLMVEKDPGFLDPQKGDFRLKPDSPVFKKLPGFKQPPMERMGLVKDGVRTFIPPSTFVYDPEDPKMMRASKAAAVARAKKSAAPVVRIPRGSFPGTGALSEGELGKPDLLLAKDVGGSSSRMTSRAWLRWDGKAIQVYIDNTVSKGTSFKGNDWGACEAIEAALRPMVAGKSFPIAVFRGFANSRLDFGQAKSGPDEPILSDPHGAVYTVHIAGEERWIARLSIPATLLDVTPAPGMRFAFNLTSRKVKDNLWLMWEPTGGHSYDVEQAGIIELAP